MNMLDHRLAHHEIDRRLREVRHDRPSGSARANRIASRRARRECGEPA